MKNRNALVVAGGVWQIPLIKHLQRRGYFVHVADPYDFSPGVYAADHHWPVDVRNAEKCWRMVHDLKLDLITTDQSDVSVVTTALLAQRKGLRGVAPEVARRFVNKYAMRRHCLRTGIPAPRFRKISTPGELNDFVRDCQGPVIVKPPDSQSSRGIIRLEKPDARAAGKAFAHTLAHSHCGYVLAEEFMEGIECTAEGLASRGHHRTLAISSKRHFRLGIASRLEYPADIPDGLRARLIRLNDAFVESSGLNFGITHAEYIVNPVTGDVRLVEIACRGGGTLISSDIAPWVSGVDIYDCLHASLRGNTVPVKAFRLKNRSALLKFFEYPRGTVRDIRGIEQARRLPGVYRLHFFFGVGTPIRPATDDRSRQGFAILFGRTRDDIRRTEHALDRVLKVVSR